VIPEDVYDALVDELSVLGGSTIQNLDALMNYTALIPQMPSIQYTIFGDYQGAGPVVKILLAPEDYVELQPDGSWRVQVQRSQWRAGQGPSLGINFICDPL
jgi:hypothetical protein